MSSAEPPGSPDDWDPDDTGGVPVGPEPEPTGAGGAGSGGWGEAPRTEPFAVAALVWAIVSIVLPIVGTIVALVLSARAADAIRRSRGTRSGTGLVTAARVVAGIVIALWAIGLVAFLALRDDDSDNGSVAVPTQPSTTSTSLAPSTSTTQPLATTTTAPLPTTTAPVRGTTSLVPPPPTQPITQPTTPVTTESPTTQPTSPPTTKPPPTTSPEQGEERRVERLLLREGSGATRIGPSNRGVPDAERVVVTYAPGQVMRVTWAIDNGEPPLPDGDATCQSPPPPPSSTSTSTSSPSTSSTTTSTTSSTTTTAAPSQLGTAQLARREARNILNLLRNEIEAGNLDVDGVQLVGTYPIEGASEGEVDVVQVFYTNADVIASWPYPQAFTAPPADDVQCLNPAFA